jgi:hypothetical protein
MTANDRAPARQGKATRGVRSAERPSSAAPVSATPRACQNRTTTPIIGESRVIGLLLGALIFSFPAFAAGIDSRTYTCAGLQALITAKGFVFISAPAFGDFVVANVSSCSGSGKIQLRSVATTDNPECVVNYCIPDTSFGSNG